MRSIAALAGLVSLFALTGCGGASGFTPVSGKVTLDGAPLEGATVSFQPKLQPKETVEGSYGKTDATGAFTLKRVSDNAPGAAAGEHIVSISKSTDIDPNDEATPPVEHVPAKYRDGSLTFTVPAGGTDKADFVLQTK